MAADNDEKDMTINILRYCPEKCKLMMLKHARLCSLRGMEWGENEMKNYIEILRRKKKVWDNDDKIWM